MEKNEIVDFINLLVDKMLHEEQWVMQITSKSKTDDVAVSHSLKLGPVPEFYTLLKAIPQVMLEFHDMIEDGVEEEFVDACLGMVKEECLELLAERKAGKKTEEGADADD